MITTAEQNVLRELASAAEWISGIAEELCTLSATLPKPIDDVFEGEAPWNLATELSTAIQCVVADSLLPAATNLAHAARAGEHACDPADAEVARHLGGCRDTATLDGVRDGAQNQPPQPLSRSAITRRE